MKNIHLAMILAAMSFSASISLAQSDVETAQKTVIESVNKADKAIADANGSSSVDLEINIDGENEDSLQEIVSAVGAVLGEDVAAKINDKISSLDADEREELEHGLKEFFEGDESDDHSSGIGETLVTLVAITFSLGMPIILVFLVLFFTNNKRKQKMQLISSYIQADKPVPEHVMADFGGDSLSNSGFRSGLIMLFFGIALMVVVAVNAGFSEATVGLIPIGIGIARLLAWKYDNKDKAYAAHIKTERSRYDRLHRQHVDRAGNKQQRSTCFY